MLAALGVLFSLMQPPVAACARPPLPDMVWVAGGGSQTDENAAAGATTLMSTSTGSGFWLGRHEVTNREFARFVEATGYTTTAEQSAPGGLPPGSFLFQALQRLALDSNWWRLESTANWRHPQGKDSNWARIPAHPVVHVTLADALAYTRWAGGMLPTETQWEYAAKAGLQTSSSLTTNTWQGEFPTRDTGADGHAGTAPVGSYAPDALGLYEMLGNVWELTRSVDETRRRVVIKGGSFLCSERYCNSAHPQARQWHDLGVSTVHVGFRLAALPCP